MKVPDWACPVDRFRLRREGTILVCEDGHAYDVVREVPRFVPDDGYAEAFGRQWLRFRTTQLDSRTGLPLSEERLRRCLGAERWNQLPDTSVLECGCGAGRFTEVLLASGAHVTSVDLSSAVDANATMFPPSDHHRVAQADIRALPFAPGGFDLVICLGVVQHTPSPEASIAAMFEHVRPGGYLVFDHYAPSIAWTLSTRPILRRLFLRMPPPRAGSGIELLVKALLPVHQRVSDKPLLRKALNRFSPVISFYNSYPSLPDQLQAEWAILDTHDALTDRYKHRRTRAALARTLCGLRATDVHCHYAGNGVEARARRPAKVTLDT